MTMQKLSHEKALEHINALMNKVSAEKEAALEDAEQNGAIPGEPAGTEQIPVTTDNNPEKKEEIKDPSEGAFAAEKHQDLKDSTDGDQVEGMAENKDGRANPVHTDFNAGSIDKESGEKLMENTDKVLAHAAKIEEKLNKVAAQQPLDGFEKLSAEEREALLFKQAADAHYMDYVQSFAAGMAKKAEDIEAVSEAKGMPPEAAAQVLDEVAAENPELVVPDEGEVPAEGGGVEGEGELSPEDAAILEEVANALQEQGVSPEELAQAAAEVEAEDGGVEKAASDRHEWLKSIVRAIR